MKLNLPKVIGASAVALSLATLTTVLPASAQTNTTGTSNVDTTPDGVFDGNYADGDWGLLGLLGLFGLLGRKSEKQDDGTVARYRDPEVVGTPGSSDY
ncbi:WGxxGxxG family protein [Leptolyngbya sp. FACHB-261]|uniref:WGxxGxxG family protein n=1 Tax=Leptolyngbya sp. FACHB-261 TaxID=2692806 RepID=UPI001681CFB7|nr:WGxxGxxG family protein [Leptolyngbya sp. FACHB-261]MBD2100053.1 WGxxGxxG-CTERM domain-containing protein [Leptolyngbya sp. FACHB-261]